MNFNSEYLLFFKYILETVTKKCHSGSDVHRPYLAGLSLLRKEAMLMYSPKLANMPGSNHFQPAQPGCKRVPTYTLHHQMACKQ